MHRSCLRQFLTRSSGLVVPFAVPAPNAAAGPNGNQGVVESKTASKATTQTGVVAEFTPPAGQQKQLPATPTMPLAAAGTSQGGTELVPFVVPPPPTGATMPRGAIPSQQNGATQQTQQMPNMVTPVTTASAGQQQQQAGQLTVQQQQQLQQQQAAASQKAPEFVNVVSSTPNANQAAAAAPQQQQLAGQQTQQQSGAPSKGDLVPFTPPAMPKANAVNAAASPVANTVTGTAATTSK